MKKLLFVIFAATLLISCSNQDKLKINILDNNEKAVVYSEKSLYNIGDTIIVKYSYTDGWQIDKNWINFQGNSWISSNYTLRYDKAIVVSKYKSY